MPTETYTFDLDIFNVNGHSKTTCLKVKIANLQPECCKLQKLIQLGLDSLSANPDCPRLQLKTKKSYELTIVYQNQDNGQKLYTHGYLKDFHISLAFVLSFAFQAFNQDCEKVNIFW
jgi:hypothetical protein